MWDPAEYLRFAGHRGRPFAELLARVPAEQPATVVDLGCGPGNMTVTLGERWPEAVVEGVDSSPQMIEQARAEHGGTDGRVRFTLADLREWSPAAPVDVVLSNATFQWVPGHLDLLPDLVAGIRPGGWFAFQVPGNFSEPSHTELAAVQAGPRWRDRLAGVDLATPWSAEPADYLERLEPLATSVDVWETTYLQVLAGEDAVLRWIAGSALRPVLDVLDEQERADFTAEYGARLRAAYPQHDYGTVLPYRRIFAVAQIGSGA